MSMQNQKSKLTSEIREAGISDKDQEFMSSFTDMMTSDSNVPSLDSVMNDEKYGVKEYTPSEKELQQTLHKAQEMDKTILKDTHPEEYKQLEDRKKQKEKEDKEYKELMQGRMLELKQEVNSEIGEFMDTTQQLKSETANRIQTLEQIKKKYKHLQRRKSKLKKKMIAKATSEALVQATEQVETQMRKEEDAKEEKEKEERDRKFELDKIRVKAEADAKVKYEVEMKHKEEFE